VFSLQKSVGKQIPRVTFQEFKKRSKLGMSPEQIIAQNNDFMHRIERKNSERKKNLKKVSKSANLTPNQFTF